MSMDFPASPTVGQSFAPGNGNQYVWDGVAWTAFNQASPAFIADTPPPNPAVGQLWWRGSNGKLYIYVDDGNSKQWVETGTAGAIPGAWEFIEDVNIAAAGITAYTKVGLDAFEFLRITGSLHPVATPNTIQLYVTENGGTSWVGDANAYFSQLLYGQAAGAAAASASSTTISLSVSNAILPGASSGGCTFILNLMRFNKTGYMRGKLDSDFQNSVSGLTTAKLFVGTQNTHTVPRNGIQISSASAFTGHLFLEGVRG